MAVWSVVLKSKLEGSTRLDPEYYQPFYLQISSSLEKQNYVELGSVALISDAGTPAISDPGYLLVRECIRNGIQVETLPGATAFVPALVNSGLPCDTFIFYGFLPQKKGRHTKLISLKGETRTMIFYESPFRLIKLLEELKEYLSPTRQVSVSRELSKLYEETARGTIEELITYFKAKTVKGEIVVVLAGKSND